ncbi:MAG: MGMT family protein [Saprospiraceae bacterium]|nr:MGMT family protein [Saprospiraceae bacterium]
MQSRFRFEWLPTFSASLAKLEDIPCGITIVLTFNMPKKWEMLNSIRAAASANGRNPIPVIIPCHRVIGSDGSLTGFALGLDIKRQLLTLENPTRSIRTIK